MEYKEKANDSYEDLAQITGLAYTSIVKVFRDPGSTGANIMTKVCKALHIPNEIAKADQDKGLVMPLQGFTVNLAQGDGPKRFVRMNAVLKFSKESEESEFNARKPQIRDTIITILNSKRPEDLLKREGKVYLKEEIKSQINSFLISGKVEEVYYVGFQIN